MVETLIFPLYVLAKDCDEIISYSSIEDLQYEWEPIDVEGEEYEAWDASGRVVELRAVKSKTEWLKVDASEKKLLETEFAKIKSRAKEYRRPEPFLKSMRSRLFGD